jgi:hypothetical protein
MTMIQQETTTTALVTMMMQRATTTTMTTGDDDDSATGDDDDDSAVGVILMDEVRIFIERNCDNDMDDDHDGIADCGDLDCADAPDCVGF